MVFPPRFSEVCKARCYCRGVPWKLPTPSQYGGKEITPLSKKTELRDEQRSIFVLIQNTLVEKCTGPESLTLPSTTQGNNIASMSQFSWNQKNSLNALGKDCFLKGDLVEVDIDIIFFLSLFFFFFFFGEMSNHWTNLWTTSDYWCCWFCSNSSLWYYPESAMVCASRVSLWFSIQKKYGSFWPIYYSSYWLERNWLHKENQQLREWTSTVRL